MSQRTLHFPLPLRTLTSPSTLSSSQWICRRCLATTTTPSTPEMPISMPQHRPATDAKSYDPSLLSSQRDYKLTKTDFYLKRGLGQRIPPQYLVHSTSALLPEAEQLQREEAKTHHKEKDTVGVVVSAGKMDKTVKVRLPDREWNSKIKKYFATHKTHLVHDPVNSLRAGDIVALHRLRVSTRVRYVVARIVSAFGTPAAERPSVPTADERLAEYKEQRFAKFKRRSARIEAAKEEAAAEATRARSGPKPKPKMKDGSEIGAKGQKLPDGVLPGGEHEVSGINERAQQNMGKAIEDEVKAEANLEEADRLGEELREKGLEAESEVDQVRQEQSSIKKKGWW